ncbi:MAG TPA: prolyl oligopeptidase family serine peptidase [Stellaceae bacterium]|nr:prolyl oligopeptidase family serine peptidase [Stellaceae bacterium]
MALQNAIHYPWPEGGDCFVFLPAAPHRSPGDRPPVLCFLHGAQEAATGSNPDGVAGHQSPAWHADSHSALTARFLVICPQRRTVGRWTEEDARSLHRVLDRAVAEHNGRPDRIFLTGFSYGGDAVFWFAAGDRGDRFQKLWAVDPAFQLHTPVPPPGRPVLVHYGIAMRDAAARFTDRAGLQKCAGDGAPVGDRLVCDLGLSHVETCRAAYGDARAYEWLPPV